MQFFRAGQEIWKMVWKIHIKDIALVTEVIYCGSESLYIVFYITDFFVQIQNFISGCQYEDTLIYFVV